MKKFTQPEGAHAEVLKLTLARPIVESDIANLPAQIEAAIAERERLELSVDVEDAAALDLVGHAQIKAALLPRRLAAKQEALGKLDAALLVACHQFVLTQLGPQGRELESTVRAKTTETLRPHFRNETELTRAVITSAAVSEVQAVVGEARLEHDPLGGVMSYASRLLRLPERFALLEQKLS